MSLTSDLRFSLRNMRKSPGLTAVAILTLALGLGANTAIFSFVDAVLLKPLPYPNADRILLLWEKPPGGDRNGISTLNYLDWHNQNTLLEYTAAVSGRPVALSGMGEPEQLNAQVVSAHYFDILGVKAALGRTFVHDEDELGKEQVALLSSRLWQRRFGADPEILGNKITLDGAPYTVVGVLPPGVFDRGWPELWLPLAFTPAQRTRNFHWFRAFAVPKHGVKIEQVRAEMDAIGARIAKDYPDSNKGWGVTTERLVERVVGQQLRQSLYVLLAAVGFVLLIACANLANLLLARGAARGREIAIRSALGAARGRLVRQLLTESALLAILGAAAGLGLGYALMKGIQSWMPPFFLPSQADVRLDYRVMLFLLAIALVTSIVFGLGPALSITGRDSGEWLKEGGRSGTAGRRRGRLRNALIVVQVGLAFVLLSGAGLLIRSFDRLMSVDPGFETTNIITMGFPQSMEQNTDGPKLTNYLRAVLDSVQSVPGVREAAVTSALPMHGWSFGMPFQIASRPFVDRANRRGCFFKVVSPSYFKALGMRLRQGRGLSDGDVWGGLPVAVINETMRKRYFAKDDPVGQRILVQQIITGKTALGPEIPWQVAGVVADEKVGALNDDSPGMYVTFMQSPVVGVEMLVRAAGDPRTMVHAIQSAVWQVNKNQPLPNIKMLEEIKSETVAPDRLRTVLMGIFAGLALAIAAVGIYGVISYSVAQRTQEIGIRAALGASKLDLLRMVIGQGMLLAVLGLALGLAGAVALTRLLSTLLFNTSPHDPVTLTAVAVVLGLVALAACYIPARQATKVDPIVALRWE